MQLRKLYVTASRCWELKSDSLTGEATLVILRRFFDAVGFEVIGVGESVVGASVGVEVELRKARRGSNASTTRKASRISICRNARCSPSSPSLAVGRRERMTHGGSRELTSRLDEKVERANG